MSILIWIGVLLVAFGISYLNYRAHFWIAKEMVKEAFMEVDSSKSHTKNQ